jgi:hypothetical protein
MSDEVRRGFGSSPALSHEDVERARRLALSRLDELEGSFNRVSERLVSVEARLGELAEDLRVRVTALQQQTRDAVSASLEGLAQREQPNVTASWDELRAVIRADVQEMTASIRAAFVEAEHRLLEGQSAFLERTGTEELRGSLEAVRAAQEALRDQVAASVGAGTEELRASLDALRVSHEALREQLVASGGTDDLRASLDALRASQESLREQLAASPWTEQLQGSLDALRASQATLLERPGTEDLQASLDALRASQEGLQERIAAMGGAGDVRTSLDALRASQDVLQEQVATSRGTEDLRASLDALREQVAASPAAAPPEDGLTTMREIESAIEALRSEMATSTGAEDLRQAVQALRAEMSLSKEGEELRAAIAALRQEVANTGRAVGTSSVDDVRAEVGVMARQVQERLHSLEQVVRELRRIPPTEPPVGLETAFDTVGETHVESAGPAGDEGPGWVPPPPRAEQSFASGEDASPEPPESTGTTEPEGSTEDAAGGGEVEMAELRPLETEVSPHDVPVPPGEAQPYGDPEPEVPESAEPGHREEPEEDVPEAAEGDPGVSKRRKKLPDLWSWGPKQG